MQSHEARILPSTHIYIYITNKKYEFNMIQYQREDSSSKHDLFHHFALFLGGPTVRSPIATNLTWFGRSRYQHDERLWWIFYMQSKCIGIQSIL